MYIKIYINFRENSTIFRQFYLIIFYLLESPERITKRCSCIYIVALKEISMRAVTLNETRRLTPRDIRRQKRRTSPTSIIMCATFKAEGEMETSFCGTITIQTRLIPRIALTYQLVE